MWLNRVKVFGLPLTGALFLLASLNSPAHAQSSGFAVARYNSWSGHLDDTFDRDGRVLPYLPSRYHEANAVAIQADGKIVVGGWVWGSARRVFALARLHANGSLDTTFGFGGIVYTDFPSSWTEEITALALQTDGKIVAAGKAWVGRHQWQFALARYHPNGALDPTFDRDGMVLTTFPGAGDAAANALAIQSDGKIVAAGDAAVGGRRFALARYRPTDGSLDTTFDFDGRVVWSGYSEFGLYETAYAVALQSDGKIVAAGEAWVGDDSEFVLERYHSNGFPDATFDGDGRVTTSLSGNGGAGAYALAIQSDGRIVAAGYSNAGYDAWGPYDAFTLARYHPNGSLDTTFGSGGSVFTGFDHRGGVVRGLAIQGDGKIVAAGSTFMRWSKDERFALARYHPNGRLDDTFDGNGRQRTSFPGTDEAGARALALQPDGKIVMAGWASIGP